MIEASAPRSGWWLVVCLVRRNNNVAEHYLSSPYVEVRLRSLYNASNKTKQDSWGQRHSESILNYTDLQLKTHPDPSCSTSAWNFSAGRDTPIRRQGLTRSVPGREHTRGGEFHSLLTCCLRVGQPIAHQPPQPLERPRAFRSQDGKRQGRVPDR